MSLHRKWIGIGLTAFCLASTGLQRAWSQQPANSESKPKERARTLFTKLLPKLNGDHLQARLVEVDYGPGESSPVHSHPCPVIVYVLAGTLRTQVKGEPEATYKAGETFYEGPNGIHLVSANASRTEPARIIAYFLCDSDVPLSTDLSGAAKAGPK